MKEAPFKIGTKVKYLGDRNSSQAPAGMHFPKKDDYKPLIFHGMKAEITSIYPPSKGLGIIDYDDEGNPVIDYDSDGCSVYTNEFGNSALIYPKDSKDWEIIN